MYDLLPKTSHEWKTIADEFEEKWDFPHCLGSIDGKHVTIKKPPDSGSFYYNYKNTFSIVLLALVNANYEFLMVDVGLNGRISDGGVLGHSDFGKMMGNQLLNIPEPQQVRRSNKILPYVFVADGAFAMTQNLLKPYSRVGNNLTEEQRLFNYRLSRARRIVENAFGILVSRFGVLQKDILLSPEKAQTIVLTCSVDFDNHETGEMHNGAWRNSNHQLLTLQTTTSRNTSDRAKEIRDMYS
ncbi:uncharacterized protein LOC112597904, partial [Melanaphis sacchari]|uniref:uncharacterized protein LOC112597904 n=1 Tax=Melanaphis sacchari TaxID=742174 RepID=UPI000DC13D0C